MLQANTRPQPISVCLSRQLHYAVRAPSTQLERLRSCPPLRASHETPAPTAVTAAADDASKAASGNASSVKAAFTEAGLSNNAIGHILKQYPHYLGWDVQQKLLPAVQSWQQELGDRFISEFERIPYLLLQRPDEEHVKDQYLTSIGIRSPELLRKRNPHVFNRSLTSIQSKVAFFQQCGFTRAQTLSLIEQHSGVLQCSSEHVAELLRVIGDIWLCRQGDTV